MLVQKTLKYDIFVGWGWTKDSSQFFLFNMKLNARVQNVWIRVFRLICKY